MTEVEDTVPEVEDPENPVAKFESIINYKRSQHKCSVVYDLFVRCMGYNRIKNT